jgi:hypothetical protein
MRELTADLFISLDGLASDAHDRRLPKIYCLNSPQTVEKAAEKRISHRVNNPILKNSCPAFGVVEALVGRRSLFTEICHFALDFLYEGL